MGTSRGRQAQQETGPPEEMTKPEREQNCHPAPSYHDSSAQRTRNTRARSHAKGRRLHRNFRGPALHRRLCDDDTQTRHRRRKTSTRVLRRRRKKISVAAIYASWRRKEKRTVSGNQSAREESHHVHSRTRFCARYLGRSRARHGNGEIAAPSNFRSHVVRFCICLGITAFSFFSFFFLVYLRYNKRSSCLKLEHAQFVSYNIPASYNKNEL